jgi:hypothetical protein
MGRVATYTGVFEDGSGRSRMEEREIEFDRQLTAPPAEPLDVASLVSVFGAPEEVLLVRGDAAWAGSEQHPAPARLLWAILAGDWQVTVDDEIAQTFGPGDLVLFEDLEGGGHSSRILSDHSLALVLRYL